MDFENVGNGVKKNEEENHESDLVQMAGKGRKMKNTRPIYSDVWRDFEKLNKNFARCKLCQKVFSYLSTITNLKKHMLVKHPASYTNLPRPQEAEMDFENIGDGVKENENQNIGSDLVQIARKRRKMKHTRRSPSDMWLHFEKLHNKFARCKLCQGEFSYRSTIANLKKHLLLKHLAYYNNLPRPQEVEMDFENIEDGVKGNEDKHNGFANHSNSEIKRSAVWNYFFRIDDCYAKCNLCRHTLSYKSNISNLVRHMRLKHPDFKTHFIPIRTFVKLEAEMDFENIGDGVKESEFKNNESAKQSNGKIKRSTVWNYFSRVDDFYAQCNVCRCIRSYKSNVSNLVKHMKMMHLDCNRNFKPRRTFFKSYSRKVAPVNPKEIEMRPSNQGTIVKESSVENETGTVPFTNAPQVVQVQSSPSLKPSYLWNFFTIINKNFAECNMCKYKLVYNSSMSNLKRHQRLKHPLTQLANNPQNFDEDDPLTFPEDHPTIQITDVQSADNTEEQSSPRENCSRMVAPVNAKEAEMRPSNLGTNAKESSVENETGTVPFANVQSANNTEEQSTPSKNMIENEQTPCRIREGVKKWKTSKVWQFFNYVDDVYALCKMCNKELSHHKTSSNLMAHKNRMHPDVPLDYFVGKHEASDKRGNQCVINNNEPRSNTPDANDSLFDKQNVDCSNNIKSIVEVERHSPKPKIKCKKGEKWSSIWRLFDRLDEKFAECKKVFSHCMTNTNLPKHTLNKHPDLFRKFTDLKNDFDNCFSELFDELLPPPKSPPPAAVNNELLAVSSSSKAADVPQQCFNDLRPSKSPPPAAVNNELLAVSLSSKAADIPRQCFKELLDEPPPPPKSPPPAVVNNEQLPMSSSSKDAHVPQQEFVIEISNNQQPHEYHNEPSNNLPIIFIQEKQHPNKTKAVPTIPSIFSHNMSNTSSNTPNNTSRNYALVPSNIFHALKNKGRIPMAASNTSENNDLVNMAAHNDNISVIASNMSDNNIHSIIEDISRHNIQCFVTIKNFESNSCVSDMNRNNGQVTKVVPNLRGNDGQVTNVVPNACGNTAASPNHVRSEVLSSNCLLNVVSERNQLLRGMQSTIQQQNGVLHRLAESIKTMKASNQDNVSRIEEDIIHTHGGTVEELNTSVLN